MNDPGVDDQGFHLGAVEQAMKASKEQHEQDERERRRLDRLAAGGSRRGSHRDARERRLATATGDATADANEHTPPSPTSSEGSLTDDADALPPPSRLQRIRSATTRPGALRRIRTRSSRRTAGARRGVVRVEGGGGCREGGQDRLRDAQAEAFLHLVHVLRR